MNPLPRPLRLACACLTASLLAPLSARAIDIATPPADVARLVVDNFLSHDEFWLNHSVGNKAGMHYAETCMALGAFRFARLTHDEALQQRLLDRYRGMLDPDTKLFGGALHVDVSVNGVVPLEAYLTTGGKDWLQVGLDVANAQWAHPRDDGLTEETRWWIDDTFMVCMLQDEAYRATGEAKYADRAGLFLSAYLRKLQQPGGLLHHGDVGPFCWGRGNGWVAVAMADTLEVLPAGHPDRAPILAGYHKMMEALLRNQSNGGMWRQVIDHPESYEESSCTAMFAYAMAVGVRKGWLDADTYGPAVDKAWKSLLARVNRKGELADVCVGTHQEPDINYYLSQPRRTGDYHGQAPLLWLADERIGP